MKIKVSAGNSTLTEHFLRQTPGRSGRLHGYEFIVNSDVETCDWWFVCHSSGLLKKESVVCDSDKIVYLSMEPDEFDNPSKFLNQFGKIVVCDRKVRHNNIIYMNPITWWVGIEVKFNGGHKFSKIIKHDYDSLKEMKMGEKKNKISLICSNKSIFAGHKKRLEFIEKLKNHHVSRFIDFYGAGFDPVLDKMDVILPYKYHLVLENSVLEDYWSEKLGDSFLGFSLPIYHGCPNLEDYFPSDSFASINIDDFEGTIKILEKLINSDYFERNFSAVIESRNLILNKYNIFQLMASIANVESSNKHKCTIQPIGDFFAFSLKRNVAKYLRKIGLLGFVKSLKFWLTT
jgi:hypothetical protein